MSHVRAAEVIAYKCTEFDAELQSCVKTCTIRRKPITNTTVS